MTPVGQKLVLHWGGCNARPVEDDAHNYQQQLFRVQNSKHESIVFTQLTSHIIVCYKKKSCKVCHKTSHEIVSIVCGKYVYKES